MPKPHDFLVGGNPIKDRLSCPQCGDEVEYNSGSRYQCIFCHYSGVKNDFKIVKIATIDWEKFIRYCS